MNTQIDNELKEQIAKNKVNFQLVLDELVKGINNFKLKRELYDSFFRNVNNLVLVEETLTVHFSSTRQTGKTNFLTDLVRKGEAILFTPYLTQCYGNFSRDNEFTHRIFDYKDFDVNSLNVFAACAEVPCVNKIKYICLDDYNHSYKFGLEFYDKLIEIFGQDFILIKT